MSLPRVARDHFEEACVRRGAQEAGVAGGRNVRQLASEEEEGRRMRERGRRTRRRGRRRRGPVQGYLADKKHRGALFLMSEVPVYGGWGGRPACRQGSRTRGLSPRTCATPATGREHLDDVRCAARLTRR